MRLENGERQCIYIEDAKLSKQHSFYDASYKGNSVGERLLILELSLIISAILVLRRSMIN